jgi:hypothetical protein
MMSNRTSHHQWEQAAIHLLNLDGWDLEWCGESTEHYDAKGKTPKGFDCIMEIKLRHSYYPTKILEQYKYLKLMQEPNCMKFYYVIDVDGNYLYHLDSLILPELVNIKSKVTEKFDESYKMNKPVYMLSESQAAIVNKNQKKIL